MNLATLDLNLLRVLDALLHEGSTVRAGDRIGLSQPAVSAALGRLRHALKDPLFVRQGSGMVPTDYARQLQPRLRQLLDEVSVLLDAGGAFEPSQSDAVFKLSGADFFAEFLIPDLARQVSAMAPAMRLQLLDLVPEDHAATLDRYEVDLAFVPQMDLPDWIDQQPVFSSRYVVIVRREHPHLRCIWTDDVLPLDLFCSLGHVLFSPEGKLRAANDTVLERMGRDRRVALTVPFFSGVCRAVSASDLIALVPHQFAERMAEPMQLAIYEPPLPLDPVQIHMIWHKRATANPAHRWLRELIARVLAPLDAT